VDRDDDLRLGMKTSAITLGRFDVAAVMLSYGLYLVIWVAALHDRVYAGALYAAVVLALLQALGHYRLIRGRTREGCFTAFRLNHWLGFTVFSGIVAGYGLK